MNEGLIPRRYAKALYEVALEKKADKRVYVLMKTLADSFGNTQGLADVLANPFIPAADKSRLLITASGATETDTVFADFLKLLNRNGRIDMARAIATAYIKIYREKNHIYEVRIESAAPLTDAEEARLKSLISRHLDGGTMEYSSTVNPDLIGGFTVAVGNERIDASISNELKQLRLNLITK